MKNSRILILLLAVLMIVSISAVSAAEDIADDADLSVSDDSTSLKVEESVDDIQAEDESDKLDDPVDTGNNFTSLQSLIDAEEKELTLEKDYARVDGDNDIQINKNFTVDGKGKYTIDAKKLGGIFNVTAGNTLTLKNLTLINGNATEAGGAILNIDGEILVYDCKFINNTALMGGAIGSAGPSTIVNSLFENNHAVMMGGAIISVESVLNVSGSKFINNSAVAAGGAIVATNEVSISNSIFDNNAADHGGAIILGEGNNFRVSDSNFTNNKANATGGAISLGTDAKTTVEGSTFYGNTAENGSAIYNEGNLTVFKNTYGENDTISSNTTIKKPESKVSISPIENVTYTKPVIVHYTIENRSSNVTVSVCLDDGGMQPTVESAVCKIEDDKVTITNLTVGKYLIIIFNNGDGDVEDSSSTAFFNVGKADPNLQVTARVTEYGYIVIDATVDENTTGNISFKVINETGAIVQEGESKIDNASAKFFKEEILPKGKYNYTVSYENENYNATTINSETPLEISKTVPELKVYSVSVNEFGHIVILANVSKDAKGNVSFIFLVGNNSESADVDVDNGSIKYDDVAPLGKGHYRIFTIYNGDENYFTTDSFNETEVLKDQINSTYEAVVTANQADITIKFPADATGNITVIYPSGYNVTMPINGTVFISEIVENGPQYILVTYPGDKDYYGFNNYKIEFFVKASSFISAKDVNVVYQNNGKVTVTLTDNNDGKGKNPIANAPVTVTLNGKTYKATTNAKGIATVTIAANLVPKAYTATVSYAGTNTTVGDKETFKFTVKKATPKLTAKKKTFKVKTKVKKYSIVLKDNKNKAMKKVKVYIKVKGKTYKATTNSKGKATFKIKNLKKKGTYKAKVTFKGSKYFNKVTKTAKIKVKR